MSLKDRLDAVRHRDDSGTALLIALVFVVVVSLVVAGVLSFANASVRTTIALRTQIAQSSNADGAAQVAIDNLRHGTFIGTGNCFGSSAGLLLSNFYQPPGGGADSAYVTCDQDTTTSQASDASSRPGYAMLALSDGGPVDNKGNHTESAMIIKANGHGVITTNGAVGSRYNIDAQTSATLTSTAAVNAETCTAGSVFGSPVNCKPGAGIPIPDPNYPAPSAPTASTPYNKNLPTCGSLMTFQPGFYDNTTTGTPTKLTNLLNCASVGVMDFRPGVYYFNFNGVLNFQKGSVVAGSINPQTATPPSDISKACESQIDAPFDSRAGVTFVLGGGASIEFGGTVKADICGQRYAPNTPPMAIYMVKSPLGSVANRIVQTPPTSMTDPGTTAAAVTGDKSASVMYYIQGMTYVPQGYLDVNLQQSSDQYFNDGIVARVFDLFGTGASVPPAPFASIPTGTPSPGRTVLMLRVYVCAGSSTCSASGTLRLQVKVGLNDPTGLPVAAKREVTVYSWSVQR